VKGELLLTWYFSSICQVWSLWYDSAKWSNQGF